MECVNGYEIPINPEHMSEIGTGFFERRIRDCETEQSRMKDLKILHEKLDCFSLSDESKMGILEHAHETWLMLNPLSATDNEEEKQNVIRFRSCQKYNPNFVETNWQHTMLMIDGLIGMVNLFPDVINDLDCVKILKQILWHDTTEFNDGDIEALDQKNDGMIDEKKRREILATSIIREHSRLGEEAVELLYEYEKRETKESKITKILDILSGNRSYYDGIIVYYADYQNLDDIGETTMLELIGMLAKHSSYVDSSAHKRLETLIAELVMGGSDESDKFIECVLGQCWNIEGFSDALEQDWRNRGSNTEFSARKEYLEQANGMFAQDIFAIARLAGQSHESNEENGYEPEIRSIDIAELKKITEHVPLEKDQRQRIYDHAMESWRFLNPNSNMFDDETLRNVYRYLTPENNFHKDFYETNWDHTCKMIGAYDNLCRYFPEAMAEFDHEISIKTILWHDTPEFLYGDIPVNQQTEDIKLVKARRELEAMKVIENNSIFGPEASEIFEQYEKRETKETILVKIIDILAGQHTFADLLFKYVAATSEEIEKATGLSALEYARYLVDDQYGRMHEIFDKWIERLMKFYGLDDYEPVMPGVDWQFAEWHYSNEELERMRERQDSTRKALQKRELRCDDDNPASRFIYALEQNHGRYPNFIMGIQYDVDHPDFYSRLRAAKEWAESDMFGNIDLFARD